MRASIGDKVIFTHAELDRLIALLWGDGIPVVGPKVADGAVVYEPLGGIGEMPWGWSDESGPGHYRLVAGEDGALFGYSLGAQGWKRHLYPPRQNLFRAERAGRGFRILRSVGDDASPPMAFLGVRACELTAIGVLDRVFSQEGFEEPGYRSRRGKVIIIAVECARAVGTCFCASAGGGPAVDGRFDIKLNEIVEDGGHVFLAVAGSDTGAALLSRLSVVPASDAQIIIAAAQPVEAARQQSRRMDAEAPGILERSLESPHWDDVAGRCLTCGNCTMVCPTCFCTTVEDVTDLSGNHAERWRLWDSCFTIDYSHIAGGALRQKASSRYRQWLTHKLSTWHRQFGMSGCVGCGRCIAWCPVGIDITREIESLRKAGGSDGTD
ncbi:4Fe-4S dicluster domain-containing protein [Telmatospirillum siberiense]|uniref:4Fe-4S ferredoxin-type domain-containing protein n=1 Tax=Telmatospirillum siberiense TaxID=382514 RepID=A0A2N3PU14_9PROT|nr:4Fe-4S dicluster domain-containing protein [Telmatospirillum siberiense]PKU23905.1 hypothetical protein CWS72_13590 [Telmatospirillum siberiense]